MIINFGISNYERNAPGVKPSEQTLNIPEVRREEYPLNGFTLSEIKNIQPRICKFKSLPAVYMERCTGLSGGIEMLWMVWIESREEWIGITYETWLESSAWGDDHSCCGPYKLKSHHLEKILEAFNVQKGKVPLDELSYVSPRELEKLAQ